jgi:hypothetical protein
MDPSPAKRQKPDIDLAHPDAALLAAKANDWETALRLHKQALDRPGDAMHREILQLRFTNLMGMAASFGLAAEIKQPCELTAAYPFLSVKAGGFRGGAVWRAAYHGHLEAVQVLCEWAQGNPDFSIESGCARSYALIKAAEHGHLDVVKFMCKLAVRVPELRICPSAQDSAAVWEAARNGHLTVVEYLLKLCSKYPQLRIDPGANSNRALRVAAIHTRLQMVRVLCACPAVDPSVLLDHEDLEVRHIATAAHEERKERKRAEQVRWSELRVGWLAALTSSWRP